MSFGRTVASSFALRRGGGTGSLAAAWGPRTLTSFSFRLLFDGLASAGGLPPGVPPPVVVGFFSLVFLSSAIGILSLSSLGAAEGSAFAVALLLFPTLQASRNRLAALHGDSFLGAVIVDLAPRPRRGARLRVEQHHVRRVNERRKIDDPA